jgi:4-amino-4-deoxy-L-arabinose transferase-like glycosyltransferase
VRNRRRQKPGKPQPASRPPDPTGRRKLVAAGLLLVVYAWIGTWGQFDFSDLMGYYNLQAEAFLAGRLDVTPPAAGVQTQDLIPFQGRYYLQWGPFPALLHAAARLLGASLSDRLVCLVAGWLTAVVFLDLVLRLRRRFGPETPAWICWWFFAAFALATPATLIAWRGTVYHESIAVAGLAVMTALWAFLRYTEAPRAVWLLLAGIAASAALTSRISQAVYAAGLLTGISVYLRRERQPLRRLAFFLAPVMAAGLLMLAYNHARFGSAFEFGMRFLPAKWATAQPYVLARMPENLCHYLLAPPRLSRDLPWIRHEGCRPVRRIETAEEMSSLILASPFLLFALLPARRPKPPLVRVFAWTAAGSGLVVFLFLLGYFWAARRYLHDFVPVWMIAAFLGAAWRARPGLDWRRWRIPATALLAVCALLHVHLTFFHSLEWSPSDPNVLQAFARWSPVVRRVLPGPKIQEQEAVVNNDLGVMRLQQGRYAEAARHFEHAARLLPGSERIEKNLQLARRLAGL